MDDHQVAEMAQQDEYGRLRLLVEVLGQGSLLGGALDLVTAAITTSLDVPVALVSLVGAQRQHFVGQTGMAPEVASGTPLSHSFCQHVVARGEALVIDKSDDDPLVCDNPAIHDLGVAAYAGQPIVVDGHVLGSVCAIDTVPRQWTEREVAALRAFADLAQYLIGARLTTQFQLITQRDGARARDRQQTARLAVYEQQANEQNLIETLNRRLQTALLPRPGARAGRHADVFYAPGSNRLLLGGDFVDTMLDEEGTLHFVIGDVTGHGPEAAALAIGLRSGWHALVDIGAGLTQTLAVLDRQTAQTRLFATVLLGSVTLTGAARIASAGHPAPIAAGGGGASELSMLPGPMLGLGGSAPTWPETEHALEDRELIAYTDGLIEGVMHPTRERFGVQRLLASIVESGSEPERLCREATVANADPLPDDVAILRIFPN